MITECHTTRHLSTHCATQEVWSEKERCNDNLCNARFVFFFQAEDGIRDLTVTGVQTCALPIYSVPVMGRPIAAPRWRIEHAQILSPGDIPRFAQLGVIASMQPSHAISDLYFAQIGRAHV